MKRESWRRYSVDEYFAVEETSEVKNEYYSGEIFAMAGASIEHNHIAANLLTELRTALRGSECTAFGSDLRVLTPGGLFTYPDVTVIYGKPELIAGRPDTVTNPAVIVEVLSVATRDYDRDQKFELYKEFSTLSEYVLVEQNTTLVEHFTRTAP